MAPIVRGNLSRVGSLINILLSSINRIEPWANRESVLILEKSAGLDGFNKECSEPRSPPFSFSLLSVLDYEEL